MGPRSVAHPFDDCVGLVLTQVTTETNLPDSDQLHCPRYHGAKILKGALRFTLQMMRIER